jgi:1,2-diacylglycerol 3-beta-galactosyltransferase
MVYGSLIRFLTAAVAFGISVEAFAPSSTRLIRENNKLYQLYKFQYGALPSSIARFSSRGDDDICRVQILMSDTGGGHRASANALRDALDVLYPGQFECDIVDIYTEYGPFWPFNGYVEGYKLMAKYPILWDVFYRFGETDFGLRMNELLLTTFCYTPFKECMNTWSGSSDKRADMVVSVHPLCQDLPLKILADLDSMGETQDPKGRTTPFVTVVTDLGGAHKTWFNK